MLLSHEHLEMQNCVAKALYDNVAESPDELAFRKGDYLTVLEQNTGGIEGWWLCCLRGRQGICPGNRLRIVPGVYDIGETDLPLHNLSKRRSWHVQPNMVITPEKFGDIYFYQNPAGPSVSQMYDTPPSGPDASQQAYDIPRALSRESSESRLSITRSRQQGVSPQPSLDLDNQSYDIPRPILAPSHPLTPSSSASSLTAPESLSLPSSNRSSLLSGPEYDIPKSRPLSTPQLYDVPAPNPKPKELPLELSSALETVNRLQNEASGAVQKLLALVIPSWRSVEHLQNGALEIKLAALRLRTSLHELSEFCEGSLGNAHKAADRNLVTKLKPLSKALCDADRIILQSCNQLDAINWSVQVLSRESEEDCSLDSLDRLVACARPLTEDIRRAASFLQGNGPLLFKKDGTRGHGDDYDYINLDKETTRARLNDIRNDLPTELVKSYDAILHDTDNNCNSIDSDDARLLSFYAALAVTHTTQLTRAIDAFLQTVEHNQPPKVFLAHGKFVVLSAHRLVHVGDTVARNVSQVHLKQKIQERADGLSDALDQTVQRTKRAAQHFPNVAAVQDMVDAIVDVSHFARDLKMGLVTAVQL